MEQKFEFTSRLKIFTLLLFVIGAIGIAYSFTADVQRTWASLLMNNYLVVGLGLIGTFFVALQYLANAGWSTLLKRIPEAFSSTVPFVGLSLVAVIYFGYHDLYEWSHEYLLVKEIDGVKNPQYDRLLAGKTAWLNIKFFLSRTIFYIAIWSIFSYLLRRLSHKEDLEGGLVNHKKSITTSAVFMFLFAFTICFAAFDWIMSLEPHWFSTIFGVYNFASLWVTTLCMITLVLIYLQRNGYLSQVNDNHFHDLGKFIFAFSIFWAYIWISQYLLIYYANFPEETVYFYKRVHSPLSFWFFFNLIINFLTPLLVFMSRDWKRNTTVLSVMCVVLIAGHWLDLFLMVMPGTVGSDNAKLGIPEISAFVGFMGMFLFFMFRTLSKGNLIPQKHPYLQESLDHAQ